MGPSASAAYDPQAPEKVDRTLRLEGVILGGILVLCFFLPWITVSFGDRSETMFSWDVIDKGSKPAMVALWFLLAGGASLALGLIQIPRKIKGALFAGLGVLTIILFVALFTEAFGKRGGIGMSGTLLLMLVIGLVGLAFGTVHWASQPHLPLGKIVAGVGATMILLAHLVPIDESRGSKKMLLGIILDGFDKGSMEQVLALYMLVPLIAVGLSAAVFAPIGPQGPGGRPAVARAAGMLAMMYLPGFFIIVCFMLMKMTDYKQKMYLLAYMGLLLRGAMSWTVHGLDAALLGDGPAGASAGAYPYHPAPPPPGGPPCVRCSAPARWIPQYNRWYCDRCQQYL